MVRRTYESDATKIESVDDIDELVADKREAWRATSDKARRRQRRYKKRLTNRLVRQDYFEDEIELIFKSLNNLCDDISSVILPL